MKNQAFCEILVFYGMNATHVTKIKGFVRNLYSYDSEPTFREDLDDREEAIELILEPEDDNNDRVDRDSDIDIIVIVEIIVWVIRVRIFPQYKNCCKLAQKTNHTRFYTVLQMVF